MLAISTLEKLSLYAQIISPLAIVVSAAIYFGSKRKDRKEKAIQVGKEIEDSIIDMIDYVNRIFRSDAPDLIKILKNADKKKMKKFERREIKMVYSDEELEEIRKYFRPNHAARNSVGAAPQVFDPNVKTLISARERYSKLFNNSIVDSKKEIPDEILLFEFHQILTKTLNKLETLCMMLTKKVADESAIYDSFSDIFLDFIATFYYYIATVNADLYGANKKLKNVIKIFNKWKFRHEIERKWQKINPYYW